MSARLSADTDLIRAYGDASATHAEGLRAAAARLTGLDGPSASMFGPVGARFLATLATVVQHEAQGLVDLSGSIAAACDAATGTAHAYEVADRLPGAW